MSSGWVPGWPVDPIDGYGPLTPLVGVTHRTYGGWAGAYATIKNNGLAQVLIGRDAPRRVQFCSLFRVMYHCNGANFRAFGPEFEGTNDDEPELTGWQEDSLAELLAYGDELGIPRAYLDPFSRPPASVHVNDGVYRGWLSHYSVQTDDGSYQHSDLITVRAFDLANGAAPATPQSPTLIEEDTLYPRIVTYVGAPAWFFTWIHPTQGRRVKRTLANSEVAWMKLESAFIVPNLLTSSGDPYVWKKAEVDALPVA